MTDYVIFKKAKTHTSVNKARINEKNKEINKKKSVEKNTCVLNSLHLTRNIDKHNYIWLLITNKIFRFFQFILI